MNSIRRTISANREAAERDRRHLLAAIGFGAVALGVAGLCGRLTLAALYAQAGAAALHTAEDAPIGPARDAALASAQRALSSSVAIAPGDARVWDNLAETYFRQATQAAIGEVSDPLLNAAAEAAARGGKGAAAATRLAVVLSFDPDRAGQAAEALARSYDLAAPLSGPGARRVETASRIWSALTPHVRQAVLAEVCAEARQDAEAAAAVAKLVAQARDRAFAAAAEPVMTHFECRPPLAEATDAPLEAPGPTTVEAAAAPPAGTQPAQP